LLSSHPVPDWIGVWLQAPLLHASLVHSLLSVAQAFPLRGVWMHSVFAQVSFVQGLLSSAQVTPLRGGWVQTPLPQRSLVQKFPSSGQVPPLKGVWTHTPGKPGMVCTQESDVHTLLSLQSAVELQLPPASLRAASPNTITNETNTECAFMIDPPENRDPSKRGKSSTTDPTTKPNLKGHVIGASRGFRWS